MLEWDFPLNHHLDLKGINLKDFRLLYHLAGPHATADFILRQTQPLSGVVFKNANPELVESQPLFVQSKLKSKTSTVLTENISDFRIKRHANKTLQTSVGVHD